MSILPDPTAHYQELKQIKSEPPLAQPQPHRSAAHLVVSQRIHTTKALQEWCAANAGGKDGDAGVWPTTGDIEAPFDKGLRFPFTRRPVCLKDGAVYVSRSHTRSLSANAVTQSLRAANIRVQSLTSSFLEESGVVTLVPAMAVLTHGNFIANHAFHLLHDVLEGLWEVLDSYRDGALWRVPRQTVLFRSRQTDWKTTGGARRVNEASMVPGTKGTALSAKLLNGFSSTIGAHRDDNGSVPFFDSSIVFEHGPEVDFAVGKSAVSSPSSTVPSLQTYCFCQAMLVSRTSPTTVSAAVYRGIRDGFARQFPKERPYDVHLLTYQQEEQDRQMRSYPRPEGQRYWQENPRDQETGAYRPRALFIHRDSRSIANVATYLGLLQESGFRVEEAHLERLPVAEQFHLGRYADLVVGMHGLGLLHGLWMDPAPPRCRAVLEFLPYVNVAFPIQFQRLFGHYLNMSFHRLAPVDVSFGHGVRDVEKEKKRLMNIRNVVSVFEFPSFANQTCVYDEAAARQAMREIHVHLVKCLYPS